MYISTGLSGTDADQGCPKNWLKCFDHCVHEGFPRGGVCYGKLCVCPLKFRKRFENVGHL